MRWLPRTLSGRIVGLTLLALLLSQCVSFFIFVHERDRFVEHVILGNLSEDVAATTRVLDYVDAGKYAAVVGAMSTRTLHYSLADTPGIHLPLSTRARGYASALATGLGVGRPRVRVAVRPSQKQTSRGRDTLLLALQLDDGRWLQARQRLFDPTAHWARSSLITLAVSALLMILIVVATSRRLTRPLRQLASAAERFGRGETVEPLAERGPDEIRRSIAAFNRMRERLARFVADRTRMIAAIAHDLRTPITALRLRLEFLPDDDNTRSMAATLDDMARMSEASLTFMREEAATEAARNVDLGALIEALCEDYRAAGGSITFDAPRRVTVLCRPAAIRRALRNIIDNALSYGERADIALIDGDHGVTVDIADHGPGIPEADRERVFDPFVRLESSRSRDTGGTGLGLSIARSVVQGHGGEIALQNASTGGLCVSMRLPREHSR